MTSFSRPLVVGWLIAAGVTVAAAGCRSRATPPDREPPPGSAAAQQVVASAAPSARPSASAAEAQVVPTLTPRQFTPTGGSVEHVFRIGGALVATQGLQVSRVVGDTLEPIGKIPPGGPALGEHLVNEVNGQWPDWVGVRYQNQQARAAEPSFIMVKGKGVQHIMGEGGQPGGILGLATVGETTLLAVYNSHREYYLSVARGPKVTYRLQGPTKVGCKISDVRPNDFDAIPPAIVPSLLAATPAGTLISIGDICTKRGAAAEVWGKDGASRIVDLHEMIPTVGYQGDAVAGQGDEVWLRLASSIVHFKDGTFEPVPPPTSQRTISIFGSPQGQLHATDGATIHRRDGDHWTLVGRLDWSLFGDFAMDEQGAVWLLSGSGYRLRERPSLEVSAGCTTPLVHVLDPAYDTPKNFTFPTTRKALASFADAGGLGLVEFSTAGSRRLGVKVTSAAQGEALVAHLATAMKDEHPRLICFDPVSPRAIALDAK